MAEPGGVVDELEVVQVDQCQRQGAPVAGGAGSLLVQRLLEGAVVAQPGEPVAGSQVPRGAVPAGQAPSAEQVQEWERDQQAQGQRLQGGPLQGGQLLGEHHRLELDLVDVALAAQEQRRDELERLPTVVGLPLEPQVPRAQDPGGAVTAVLHALPLGVGGGHHLTGRGQDPDLLHPADRLHVDQDLTDLVPGIPAVFRGGVHLLDQPALGPVTLRGVGDDQRPRVRGLRQVQPGAHQHQDPEAGDEQAEQEARVRRQEAARDPGAKGSSHLGSPWASEAGDGKCCPAAAHRLKRGGGAAG